MSKIKAYFPRLTNTHFTSTPNIFFDKVMAEASTLNQVRAVGFVIRKTLGWQKKYDFVSRDHFISQGGISNGQLSKTLQDCVNKGWLLRYRTGPSGMEETYYFLNDSLNALIVEGLEAGLFNIKDLRYRNDQGLIELLTSHGIEFDPDKDSVPQDEKAEDLRKPKGTPTAPVGGTDSVDGALRRPEGTPYGIRRPTPTAPVDTKEILLNTSFKNNLNNIIIDDDAGEKEDLSTSEAGSSEDIAVLTSVFREMLHVPVESGLPVAMNLLREFPLNQVLAKVPLIVVKSQGGETIRDLGAFLKDAVVNGRPVPVAVPAHKIKQRSGKYDQLMQGK
ncbi:MAG: replication protein [Bacillota bacterium]